MGMLCASSLGHHKPLRPTAVFPRHILGLWISLPGSLIQYLNSLLPVAQVGHSHFPLVCPIYRFYTSALLSSTQVSGLSSPTALGDRHLLRYSNYAFVTLSKFKELNDTESGSSGDTSLEEKPCLSSLHSRRVPHIFQGDTGGLLVCFLLSSHKGKLVRQCRTCQASALKRWLCIHVVRGLLQCTPPLPHDVSEGKGN